jgi:hypothetical protein
MFQRASINFIYRQTSTESNMTVLLHAHEARSGIQLKLQLQIDRQI